MRVKFSKYQMLKKKKKSFSWLACLMKEKNVRTTNIYTSEFNKFQYFHPPCLSQRKTFLLWDAKYPVTDQVWCWWQLPQTLHADDWEFWVDHVYKAFDVVSSKEPKALNSLPRCTHTLWSSIDPSTQDCANHDIKMRRIKSIIRCWRWFWLILISAQY